MRTGFGRTLCLTGLLAFAATGTAAEGDWKIRAGIGTVDPKSDNGDVVSVDSGTTAVVNGTYMISDTIGLEVLASLPFSHDINLEANGAKVGETKHLPPTFSLQYYFPTSSAFSPYAGLGLNWTIFFDEETEGALAGTDLSLDDSIGLAAQLGFDYDLSDTMFINFDVRWIDIETDAEVDGTEVETVEITPLVYSVTLGWRF